MFFPKLWNSVGRLGKASRSIFRYNNRWIGTVCYLQSADSWLTVKENLTHNGPWKQSALARPPRLKVRKDSTSARISSPKTPVDPGNGPDHYSQTGYLEPRHLFPGGHRGASMTSLLHLVSRSVISIQKRCYHAQRRALRVQSDHRGDIQLRLLRKVSPRSVNGRPR